MIQTRVSATVAIRFSGRNVALLFLRLAFMCGLTEEVESVEFDEPVQDIADRLAVESLIERAR